MNKRLTAIFVFLISLFCVQTVFAASLDDIYRDVVRDNNSGYLPVFVRNRNIPELIFEDDLPKPEVQAQKQKPTPVVNLIDERKIKQQELLAEQARWQAAVKAVQENKVTPKELKIIDDYVKKDDAKAVEIKAWMYAKGQGVQADLVKSFKLYRKAEKLGVENALKNAAQVYRAMTREQRESLSNVKQAI